MQDVSELLQLHEQLRQERRNYENQWQAIAERVAPSRANFKEHRSHMDEAMYKGKNRTEHIYDATPALALQRFSAALASLATPKNRMWHDLKAIEESLNDDEAVKDYTDAVRDILFSARYSANFDTAVQECYTDAGCFGNACMYVGERLGKGLYYRHVPLEQAYWLTNEYGVVDWVDREFSMTARQAYERFGDRLPATIINAKERTPNQRFWFVHMVRPNKDREEERRDARGMAYESLYISLTGSEIVGNGGYRTMPYSVLRFTGDSNYGEGPCALVLPDIKMLNVMNRDMMQAAELAVMPPLLAARDGVFSATGINLTPGAVNYGGVDDQGRQLAIPMQFGANIPIGLEMMEQKRMVINDALWNTLFQILVDTPAMTATDGFSRSEAQGFMDNSAQALQQEIESALGNVQAVTDFRQSVDAVRQDIQAQLNNAGRFTEDVNNAYSSLVSNFYGAMAQRLGITPQELYQQYPLSVRAESVVGDTLSQSVSPSYISTDGLTREDAARKTHDVAESVAQRLRELGATVDIQHSGSSFGPSSYISAGFNNGYQLPRVRVSNHEKTGKEFGSYLSVASDESIGQLVQYAKKVASLPMSEAMELINESTDARKILLSERRIARVTRALDKMASGEKLSNSEERALLEVNRMQLRSEPLTEVEETALNTAKRIYDDIEKEFYQTDIADSVRGAFSPDSLTISLLGKADLSTFLHETGHLFLELMERMVAQVDQSPEVSASGQAIAQDMQTVLDWFGIKDFGDWRGMTLEEKRPYHEQFARGFEAYLFEGKAPSIELQGIFQRFRAWLLNVYRSLLALNVNLTDEVRGVFDRLLATDEQIAIAEQGRDMMPLFENPQQAGMTAEEFQAYQALGTDATAQAQQELQAKGMRDMQWLHNFHGRVVAELQKTSSEIRSQVRQQVRDEVMAEPIYQAWDYLKSVEGGKLSHQAVSDMYMGEGDQYALLDWKRLQDQRMVTKEETGLHPDMVAEMFGFTSGDELIRRLVAVPSPSQEVEALTDARMLEQYGELATPEAIAREADKAIHNRVRTRMVATEHNALAKATGQTKILASAAREYAARMVDRLRVRDIQPSRYANAEARAAREAQKSMRAGNLAEAATHKRNQLIQNHATRAAYDAQTAIDAGIRYLNKFNRDVKGLDADYMDQIQVLLDRFDLRRGQSLRAIDRRQSLRDWIESQRGQGMEPDIPQNLIDEAYRTSYKNLTFEDFRGLVDTVKQIEHLGRLKNRLLTARDQRDYEVARDAIVASIEENARGRTADTRTPTTDLGRVKAGIKNFFAQHIKAATIFRILDGGKDGGPAWEYIMRPANAAANWETNERAKATLRLTEIMSPVLDLGKMGGKGRYFESVGRSFNRESVLAIALNTGNEGNLQRLLGGEGWTYNQIIPVLRSMTKQEWQAVQEIWDHFESYKPQIAAKERRVYGKEPEWVEPKGFSLQLENGETVDVKGGYYPIKYDPNASERAESHADAEAIKTQMQGAYTSATTRRSFTKSRVNQVVGRPLLYSLEGIYSGVNDVIHDLAWHEFLIDANKLLRSNRIDSSIRNHYGPEFKQQLKNWLRDVAQGEGAGSINNEAWISKLRQHVSAAGLGFNLVSALIQPIGITQSVARIGGKWVGRGIRTYISGPIAATKEANAKSDFMRMRAQTRFRELNELKNRVHGDRLSLFRQHVYVLMLRCQQMVDVPTWHGAYEKAISEGNNEQRSIELADQAVIDSQGSGLLKDQSAIERGGPALKLFTVFYAFFNTTLNMTTAQTMTQTSKGRLAADYLMLLVIPAVMDGLLREALSFGDKDEDKDLSFWAKKMIGSEIDFLMNMFVGVRELSGAVKIATGTSEFPGSYQGPAGVRFIADAYKFSSQAVQGEFDEAFRKSLINLAGDALGLPSAQINRTISGVEALAEGRTDNPLVIGFGYKQAR